MVYSCFLVFWRCIQLDQQSGGFGLALRRFDLVLGKAVQILCVALLGVIVLTISVSILTRFVFFTPLNFADALAKYLMIWLCFLGSGLAIRSGEHVIVEMFSNKLSGKSKKIWRVFVDIGVSILFIFIIYNGITFSLSVIGSTDPFVFGISMFIPYVSVPIGFVYMLIQLNITTILSLLSTENEPINDM